MRTYQNFECHNAHFDRLSANGIENRQAQSPFGLSLSKPERAGTRAPTTLSPPLMILGPA